MVRFFGLFKYLAVVFALLYSGWACAFSATSAEARPGTGSGPFIRVYFDSNTTFCSGDFVVTINGVPSRPSCSAISGTNMVTFQLSSALNLSSTDTITVTSDMMSGSPGFVVASNFSQTNLNPAMAVSTVYLPSPLQAQASLTLLASPSSLVFGSSASSTLSTTGGSGTGAVTYAVTSGSCGLVGQMLSVGFAMAGSTCTVTATKAADPTYASTTATLNVSVVALSAQSTLTALASPTSITAGTGTSALSTSGGSGTGAVTYSVTSGACTVSGSTLSAGSAAGGSTCTVTATKAADSTYNSTTATVNVSVVALTAQSTLTALASPSSITVGTGSSTLSTSGGSGTGAISYAVTAGACTVSGNTLSAGSATGGSTCTVTATKAADSTYALTTATVNVSVVALSAQAALTASASPTSIVVGTGTSILNTSGGSGTGAVTYAVTSGSCTVSGSTLSAGTAVAGSTCTVTATKAADSTYTSGTSTVSVSVVALTAQTITASASPTSIIVGTGTSTLSTSGGSGTGAVTYAVTSGACTVSGNTLSVGSAAGGSSCTVTATKAADSAYASATTTVNVSVLALSAQASLTASASPMSIPANTGTSTLSTSGGSGAGAVTYAVTSGSCTVSGSTLSAGTAVAGSTCTVTATKAADSTYAATTATVNVGISSRRSIDATVDASVKGMLAAQVTAVSRFSETQMRNVTEHLNQLGMSFNVRANRLGVGLNSPLLRPTAAQNQPAWAIAANGQGQNMVDSPNRESSVETVLAQNSKDATPIAAKTGSVASELNDAVFGQMGLSIWASGDVVHGRMGVNSSTNNFHTDGLTLGFDHLLNDKTIVGMALGYGTDNTKVDDFHNGVRGSQWTVTAYGVYKPQEGVLLDALLGRGQSSFDNNRYADASGSLLSAVRKGSSTVVAVGASAPLTLQSVNLKPYLRASHMDLNMGAYSEAGDVNALSYGKAHLVTQSVFAGLIASYDIPDATGGKWTPNAKLELRRNSTGSMLQSISYADTPSESTTLLTTASPRDQQTVALGVQYTRKQGGQLSLGWSATNGTGNFRANGYKLQLRLPF